MKKQCVRIGGATGYWGDADMAVPQFLADGDVDFIVFDYLAEITMSILARARAADPAMGYATDFVTSVIKPHLTAIASSNVRLISNAGGVNPERCATVVRELIAEAGLKLSVAVVTGDDLMPQLSALSALNPEEMFSGDALPPLEHVASANAYLGAFPIAKALDDGADIVITGRCVDSAVTLGACIHSFGWTSQDLDHLATGSLAGHIIECGAQATGGNYTDWQALAGSLHNIGYPIAQITDSGDLTICKPRGTGGAVTVGTVGEQILYEIGDPAAYYLPDVICDFSHVTVTQEGTDRVEVRGAKGTGIPDHYKASITWADGWRAGTTFFYVGSRAAEKARIFANVALERSRSKLHALGVEDFQEVSIEVVGDESHYGSAARYVRSREVTVKVACRHAERSAAALLLRELTGAALGAPAGLFMFAGSRPKPSPVIRLFSTLVPKDFTRVDVLGENSRWHYSPEQMRNIVPVISNPLIPEGDSADELVSVPLERLAWARSGDKGNKANIGVIARKADYLPWIARTLTVDSVNERFAHFLASPAIDRYYMPGLHALNFVLHEALGGGGVASLRNDPQAKCYAQLLLDVSIPIPKKLIGDD